MPRIPVHPPIPPIVESTPEIPQPPPARIQSDQQQLPSINQMMGQNQQCLQCSSWDHTTFNCHMGIHDSIKICANCKRRGHWSEDCKTSKVLLVHSKKPFNYCLKLHHQTVLNCPLRYEHLKELSKEQHSSEKLMEKVGLSKDVM